MQCYFPVEVLQFAVGICLVKGSGLVLNAKWKNSANESVEKYTEEY